MANYSATEIRAFKLKDILNSRMSALKAAATVNEGKSMGTKAILTEADEYYGWLRQDQDQPEAGATPDTTGSDTQQVPEPTLAQKKVLDAISEKAFDGIMTIAIKTKVLDWAEATHGQRSYPTKLESVETFLKWFNN